MGSTLPSDSKWLRETNGYQREHVAARENKQITEKRLQTLLLRCRKVNKAKRAIQKRLRKAVSWR